MGQKSCRWGSPISGRGHDRALRASRPRHAARRARRRRRMDRRLVLSHRGDADAVRHRPRPRTACAHRARDPLARRAAREPARTRPPGGNGSRGWLARPDPDGARSARARRRRQRARALVHHRPAARRCGAAARPAAQSRPEGDRSGCAHLAGGHAGADLHRPHRRGAHRCAAARRPPARDSGLAVDGSRADLRRRGLKRGDCRADPVRHAVEYSVRADADKPRHRSHGRGDRAAARAGLSDAAMTRSWPARGGRLTTLPPAWRTTRNSRHKRVAMSLIDLANPSRFLALIDRMLPWLLAATLLAFAFGISQAYLAPDDYQQGATVKIMFIHVPAAWLGLFAWMLMSAAALGTLVWRHPLADVAAKAAAPIGAAFTLMCLVT